tara:strand:- start:1151 stop:2176 length:1026 start_codon:yes stop_codon:yes gene_type:complete
MKIQESPPNWIKNGEKFALIGLPVRLSPDVLKAELPGGLTIFPSADFELPNIWREWLGTIRVEEIGDCTLFLLAKLKSTSIGILDKENQKLSLLVHHWYTGLTLTCKFDTSDAAFLASGCCKDGNIDVREFGPINPSLAPIVNDSHSISIKQLWHASEISLGLRTVADSPNTKNWRILQCLQLYQEARCNRNIMERIHQFTRCIEGLIAGEAGKTKKQFKSRTETFIGPRYHNLMDELYELRSAIEHLNDNIHLAEFNREARISVAKLEATSEWIARSCLERILLNKEVLIHFGNIDSIKLFWQLSTAERQEIWGSPVDPEMPFRKFNFDHVSDQALGAFE